MFVETFVVLSQCHQLCHAATLPLCRAALNSPMLYNAPVAVELLSGTPAPLPLPLQASFVD
jgi:hypothetical protein